MSRLRGFARYELDERIIARLKKLGFRRPTEVQERVIPLFLQKRNLIVEAPTGTGKTAAYGFPLISRLDLMKRKTQALVLVPSRELAIQVSNALQSYYEGDRLKVGAVYGGVPVEESYRNIKSAPHILVVVPGRLKDVMGHYKYDYLWRDIKFLIIDEGDKLMEMGFQKDFDEIKGHIRSTAQVGFFSATISADSEAMMRERFTPIQTVRLSPKEMLQHIQFGLTVVKKGQREPYLAGLLKGRKIPQALIFCGRRKEIYGITGFLRNCGFKAEAYYGDQEQNERENILARFKEGHIDYLVASDLAARGLDIERLPAVINLSIPTEFDFYLHRVGRTGRAGNKGMVFNIIASNIEAIRLKSHHRAIELPLHEVLITPLDLSALEVNFHEKWIKYHLSRGKRDKVRKGDIVGFLSHSTSLSADEIGTITIYDSYSIVDLPQKGFMELTEAEEPLKLKGKSVKIRKYQVDEQEKRALSVKKLKKDRR